MSQDASVLKDKIVSLLSVGGPALPVAIAKNISSSTLFASAFLSELVEEKRIKMSSMRVGSSPVYFLPGQEAMLERFSQHLKSKEKEAFLLLKEKKFLPDSEQQPAIRVALREIRDFAIPFESPDGLVWRFMNIPETDFIAKEVSKKEILVEKQMGKEQQATQEQEPKEQKVAKAKKKLKKRSSKSKNYDFFNKVKDFLSSKNIEISEVKNMGSNEVVLIIKDKIDEVLVAFNKKKLTDSDIINAAKKASEFSLPFRIYSNGEALKRTKSMIDAVKNLSSIEKIDKTDNK